MAYLFDDASNEYIEVDSAPITAAPLTWSCWAYVDDLSIDSAFMWLGDKDVSDNHWHMKCDGNGSDQLLLRSRNNALGVDAITTNAFSVNTWHHCFAIITNSTDRTAILDGDTANKGTNTTSSAPDDIDRFTIGRNGDSTPNNEMSGRIAEVAMWDVALTEAEGVWLSKGFSPLTLTHRLTNLKLYRDLIRDLNRPYIGASMTAFNNPVVSEHPPMIYSAPRTFWSVPAAVGAVDLPYQPHYQRSPILAQ